MTATTWTRKHTGAGGIYYTATIGGLSVVIRATGQRNGRTLGGAWRASADGQDIARGGTLRDCKRNAESAVTA